MAAEPIQDALPGVVSEANPHATGHRFENRAPNHGRHGLRAAAQRLNAWPAVEGVQAMLFLESTYIPTDDSICAML